MYSRDLLRLGLRLAEQGRLNEYHGSAKARSRACGSTVIADVQMLGDRVTAFGQEVKACAVGQASAAILGSHIAGLTRAEVRSARETFADYLNGSHDELPGWTELQALAGVRDYQGRHAAALLPYDAALAAIDQAKSASKNAATSAS